MSAPGAPHARARDGLLRWIAAERSLRAALLAAVGAVLISHPHTDWAAEVTSLARSLGLNPSSNWVRRIVGDLHRTRASQDVLLGILALAYGALESVEAYGLWRRRRWGEWLTVLATSLLLIPEVWELTRSISALKAGALAVNLLVVAYLLGRLRRAPAQAPQQRAAPASGPGAGHAPH